MHSFSSVAYNQAMHRMPKPPLRYGFVTGDGSVKKPSGVPENPRVFLSLL